MDYNYPGEFPLFQCLDCTLGYLGKVPSSSALKSAYPPDYREYHKRTDSKSTRLLGKSLSLISAGGGSSYYGLPLAKPESSDRRALDIGAGSGHGCRALRDLGWDAIAVDFNIPEARAPGVPYIRSDLARLPLADDSFDFVIGSNVLEHVYQPVEVLSSWRRLLSSTGTLAVAVPNFASLDSRMFGPDWHGLLSIPRHLVHFTPRSLKLAFKLAGFQAIRVNSLPYPSSGGSVSQRVGVAASRLRGSQLLVASAILGLPMDLLSFMMKNGSNLIGRAAR